MRVMQAPITLAAGLVIDLQDDNHRAYTLEERRLVD